MKKYIKLLITFYTIIVILKILLSLAIPAPSVFSDDYVYMKLARSFFYDLDFSIHGLKVNIFPPLYPILLSSSYIFKDAQIIYFMMKVINALISSLIIVPVFLLSRQFLNEKKSLIVSILISIAPFTFSLSSYIMSENLFYLLFMFSIYFIYMSYSSNKSIFSVLAGILAGLTFLTRIIGISLVGIILLASFILFLLKKKDIIKKTLIILLLFFLITIPWIIIAINGSIINAYLGSYSNEAKSIITNLPIIDYMIRFILYLSFIILSTLIIFPLKSLQSINKKNMIFSVLFLSSLFIALIIAANHGARGDINIFEFLKGRYIERYIAYIFPLIFIGGFIGLEKNKPTKKLAILIFSLLVILGAFLALYPLFPINHLSLSWIGIITYLMGFSLYIKLNLLRVSLIFFAFLFLSMFLFILFLERKNLLKKTILYILLFFIAVNILNFAIIYYDSKTNFYDKDQMQLGLWLNNYDPKLSNVLFDERDCGNLTKYEQESICGGFNNTKTIIAYWLNDNIIIGDPNKIKGIDYIITRHEMNLELLYQTKSKIYLYRTE